MLWVLIRIALAVLVSTHNIGFYGEISKSVPQLDQVKRKRVLCHMRTTKVQIDQHLYCSLLR